MDIQTIERIKNMLPLLNERQRRLYLANEAKSIGRGGISWVSRVSGVSRVTITQGMSEVDSADRMPMDPSKSRKKGGGRKLAEEKIPGLTDVIEDFMEPHTGGDPMNPLKWTSKSLRAIEEALAQKGYIVSDTTIGEILRKLGYTLQANRKDISISASHPDRDAQFEYINRTAQEYMAAGWPVVSVDAKKKEKIGNFKNYGTEYVRKGKATKVLDHDFDQSA